MTRYAVCDVNGPISHRLEDGEDIERDGQKWIDDADTEAEDDLGIDGTGMTEDQFEEALEGRGARLVEDCMQVHSHPSSPMLASYHIAGGWRIWEIED